MANIASQNLRNLINTLSTSYKLFYTFKDSTIATDISDTVQCVWDGQQYLVYNIEITDNVVKYTYIGTGVDFLKNITLESRT